MTQKASDTLQLALWTAAAAALWLLLAAMGGGIAPGHGAAEPSDPIPFLAGR